MQLRQIWRRCVYILSKKVIYRKSSVAELLNFDMNNDKLHLQDEQRSTVLLRRPTLPKPKQGLKQLFSRYENNEHFVSYGKSSDEENSVCLSADTHSVDLYSANYDVVLSSNRSKRTSTVKKRQNDLLENDVENQFLMRPLRVKGTSSFPAREVKHNPVAVKVEEEEEKQRYYTPNQFTLQDFVVKLSEMKDIPLEAVQKVIYSRNNYQTLQKLLLEKCQPKCGKLHTQELHLPDDFPAFINRIPQKQLLLEMAAVIKEQVCRSAGVELKSVIQHVSRYRPCAPLGSAPLAEIILYENCPSTEKEDELQCLRETEAPAKSAYIYSAASHYFQGTKRSSSPFEMIEPETITPSEVSVLDSIMNGGTVLNLKAHFISVLPDTQPLTDTLTYLDLSYNCFLEVPSEVFAFSNLSVLKLRNNPLTEIPDEISKLHQLKIVVISFTLLTLFPPQLLTLKRLEQLDLSYNRIPCIPEDISCLQKLQDLNVAGNRLYALPASMLKMFSLTSMQVIHNYMHPVFWKELALTGPRIDEYCIDLEPVDVDAHFPRKQGMTCNFCGGQISSSTSFQTIRPVRNIFGVKNVPILFNCCSEGCLENFLKSEDNLKMSLYGEKENGKV